MNNKNDSDCGEIEIRQQNSITVQKKNFAEMNYEFFENFSSPHTKTNYKNDLKQFFSFLKKNFSASLPNIREIKKAHVISYRKFLEKEGGKDQMPAAPKTIIRKLACLSKYWKHLFDAGLVDSNICDGVTRPKMSIKTETLDFSDQESIQMQEMAGSSPVSGPLHRAILAVLFGTGMRKSELLSLKRSSYQEEKGHRILVFEIKGNRWHKVPLNPSIIKHIEAYLLFMQEIGKDILPHEKLFQPIRNNTSSKRHAKGLSASTIDYIVKINAKKLGIKHRVSPHSIRATVIGHLIEEGKYSLDEVARFVNHKSVDTTRTYDKRKRKLENSPVFGNKLVP